MRLSSKSILSYWHDDLGLSLALFNVNSLSSNTGGQVSIRKLKSIFIINEIEGEQLGLLLVPNFYDLSKKALHSVGVHFQCAFG